MSLQIDLQNHSISTLVCWQRACESSANYCWCADTKGEHRFCCPRSHKQSCLQTKYWNVKPISQSFSSVIGTSGNSTQRPTRHTGSVFNSGFEYILCLAHIIQVRCNSVLLDTTRDVGLEIYSDCSRCKLIQALQVLLIISRQR